AIDQTSNYSKIGGGLAYAITISSMESASKAVGKQLFELISEQDEYRFPIPIGNILGGGVHAGPGTPDIQEILISAPGAKTIRDAIETNFKVHKELRNVIEKADPSFTNGRGDEGGWAPKCDNEKALELCAVACENLGYTLGKEVSLGVDFASSTQWNEEKHLYVYERAEFENTPEKQIEFVASIIEKYKLIYAEDAVHEEAFGDMSELVSKFPKTMITGDDLTVTNKDILKKAIENKSCNAAILKVNQAGSLYDALEFAKVADNNDIKLITSHRSGESIDSQISHIGIGTNSKMLKVGVVGGERVAKLNELIRLSEHDLIQGMAEV
ncbi:MAG: enolase, partial [Thermoproteota archaeon]|nr:enolase [Thermoproteota archaeon]